MKLSVILSCLLIGLSLNVTRASSFDDVNQNVQFKRGDLITLPNQKGNYIMILWGGEPVWYDERTEDLTFMPIRNWSTVKIDVTGKIPAPAHYEVVEINAIGDPYNLDNWRWTNVYKLEIVKCDLFYSYALPKICKD